MHLVPEVCNFNVGALSALLVTCSLTVIPERCESPIGPLSYVSILYGYLRYLWLS